MEIIRDLKRNKTLLGFLCTLTSKTLLSFIDIVSVNVCFWTVLWLLYFTFLKDSIDIFVYTFVKYTDRLKWLYKILRIRSLLEIDSITAGAISGSPREEKSELVRFQQLPNHSIKSLQSVEVINNLAGHIDSSPDSSGLEDFLRDPATPSVRSESNASTSAAPEINYDIIVETNFENVDLADERNGTSPVSEKPFKQKPSVKRAILGWKFDKVNILDSLRNNKLSSLCSAKTKWRNTAEKVANVLPVQTEDKEQLLLDSPEQEGCSAALSHFFRSRLQMSSTNTYSMQYERF